MCQELKAEDKIGNRQIRQNSVILQNFLEEKSKKQKKYKGSSPPCPSQSPCKYRNLLNDQNILNSLSAGAEPQILIPP